MPLFAILVTLLIAGSFAFHHLYEKEPLGYLRALYITYCLVFMEHLIPFPEHWLLQAFYFVLPVLGLVRFFSSDQNSSMIRFRSVSMFSSRNSASHSRSWVSSE